MSELTTEQRPAEKAFVQDGLHWRSSLFGLGSALCFAISPVFVRYGLQTTLSPLIGITIGMTVAALASGLVYLSVKGEKSLNAIYPKEFMFQIAAGVLAAISNWAYWVALDRAPVAVVIALSRIYVPIVILLSLLLVGQKEEQVTSRFWLGGVSILIGSFILLFAL